MNQKYLGIIRSYIDFSGVVTAQLVLENFSHQLKINSVL